LDLPGVAQPREGDGDLAGLDAVEANHPDPIGRTLDGLSVGEGKFAELIRDRLPVGVDELNLDPSTILGLLPDRLGPSARSRGLDGWTGPQRLVNRYRWRLAIVAVVRAADEI